MERLDLSDKLFLPKSFKADLEGCNKGKITVRVVRFLHDRRPNAFPVERLEGSRERHLVIAVGGDGDVSGVDVDGRTDDVIGGDARGEGHDFGVDRAVVGAGQDRGGFLQGKIKSGQNVFLIR